MVFGAPVRASQQSLSPGSAQSPAPGYSGSPKRIPQVRIPPQLLVPLPLPGNSVLGCHTGRKCSNLQLMPADVVLGFLNLNKMFVSSAAQSTPGPSECAAGFQEKMNLHSNVQRGNFLLSRKFIK